MSRLDISDLTCESTVLTDVKFRSDWQKPVKNLRMHNFQAKNIRFRDCQFDDTEFLDCAIDGLRFEGVILPLSYLQRFSACLSVP